MTPQAKNLDALRAKLVKAEEGGASDRTPAQIRKEAKARLKQEPNAL